MRRNDRWHWELNQIWLTLDADAEARVAVVTGAGRAFSAGGDLNMVEANSRDPKRLARTVRLAKVRNELLRQIRRSQPRRLTSISHSPEAEALCETIHTRACPS